MPAAKHGKLVFHLIDRKEAPSFWLVGTHCIWLFNPENLGEEEFRCWSLWNLLLRVRPIKVAMYSAPTCRKSKKSQSGSLLTLPFTTAPEVKFVLSITIPRIRWDRELSAFISEKIKSHSVLQMAMRYTKQRKKPSSVSLRAGFLRAAQRAWH